MDVIELLEKRVKSRFSHRQFFLHLGREENSTLSNLDHRLKRLEQFLLIPKNNTDFTTNYKTQWNSNIKNLLKDKNFICSMQRLLDIDLSETTLKNVLVLVLP